MKNDTSHSAVIAAQPGYYVLEPIENGAGIEALARVPIVAWVVSYEADSGEITFPHALYVTYEGASCAKEQRGAILNPNGTVDEPFFTTWDNEEDYLNHLRQAYEQRARAKDL